eukprot:761398-Hanusia_phi.AAC.3
MDVREREEQITCCTCNRPVGTSELLHRLTVTSAFDLGDKQQETASSLSLAVSMLQTEITESPGTEVFLVEPVKNSLANSSVSHWSRIFHITGPAIRMNW